MDKARYVLALISLLAYPPAVTYWLWVHPLVGFWRRLGTTRAFVFLSLYALAVMAGLYALRKPLLSVEFGTNRLLWVLVVLFYGASIYIDVRARKHLKARMLLGVPEIAPERADNRLLTDGIYGKIRHPRYVAVMLGTFAVAFFTNYLAVYVIALLCVPALYLVVLLEERELRERFGDEFVRYAERVPRFLPKFRSGEAAAK